MLGIHDLPLFILSGLLLNIAPGPDSLLIVTRSAQMGWRAGSAAALGIGAGTLVHIMAAAFGLSALLLASSTAFTVVKLLGAAYLVYAGSRMLWQSWSKTNRGKALQAHPEAEHPSQSQAKTQAQASSTTGWQLFAQGFLTNVLNPKVAVFFLAFVPQFIMADAPNKPLSFIILGCIFNFNGMLWCHFLAFSSAYARHKLQLSERLRRWLNRVIGALFVSFGIKLALSQSH